MYVDRARFIALTLTIAAGCGVQPSRGVTSGRSDRPVPIPPVQSAPRGEPLRPGPPQEEDGGKAPAPVAATVSAEEPAPDYSHLPPAEQELMRRLTVLVQHNSGCGPLRPPSPPPPPGWRAEEPPPPPLVGQAKRCAQINRPWELPGPHCESWSLDCEEAVSALKPTAGQRTIACLQRKSGTRAICGFNTVTHCVVGAARATRSDARVDAACQQVMAICQGKTPSPGATRLTVKDCRHYLSAVDCPGTEEAGYCLAQGCALEPCINPLW